MAKTKIELEQDYQRYRHFVSNAHHNIGSGNHKDALGSATDSLPFIDGMIQFERRFNQNPINCIEAFDIIFDIAPLLFDFKTLNVLEEFVKSNRRVSSACSEDFTQRLSKARAVMWNAHSFWSRLLKHGVIELNPNDSIFSKESEHGQIMRMWEQMRLVRRVRDGSAISIELVSNLKGIAKAKCHNCGARVSAEKYYLLDRRKCPTCGHNVYFVFIVE